jgi:hypothetical protein
LVLPQQAGATAGVGLAKRIDAEAGRFDGFDRPGKDLQQQGIGRVAGTDSRQIRPRRQQRKAAGRQFGLGRQRSLEAQQAAKFGRASDAFGLDRLPIGPA